MWSPDCRLPWRQRYRTGDAVCWEGPAPAQLQLAPGKSYLVQYTLNVCAASPAEGSILLRQTPCGVFTDTLPLRFSVGPRHQTLQHVCVLHPRMNGGSGAELALVLNAGAPVCVEQAVMDVIELW